MAVLTGSEDERPKLFPNGLISNTEYMAEHFSDDTPLSIQQATHNLYRTSDTTIVDHVLTALDLSGRERLLDLGCGNGFILRDVASRLRLGGEITAIDLAAGMLDAARESVNVCWVPVHWIQADAYDVCDLGIGTFDRIMLNFLFHYISEPDRLLNEVAALLRDGGRLIVTVEAQGSMHEMYDLHFRALRAAGVPEHLLAQLPSGRRGVLAQENARAYLERHFARVDERPMTDSLRFLSAEPYLRFYGPGHAFCGARHLSDQLTPDVFANIEAFIRRAVDEQIRAAGSFEVSKTNSTFVCTQ